MVSPSLTPVSTRMPGPAGSSRRVMRPGEGAKPRSGSSAFSRASMAGPPPAGAAPSALPPGAFIGVTQVGLISDHADPAAPTACGRLEHQRVADAGRRSQGGVQGLNRAATPRRDRHADLLGDQLRTDLVTEPAHRLRA